MASRAGQGRWQQQGGGSSRDGCGNEDDLQAGYGYSGASSGAIKPVMPDS